jgi:hypothetical protein
MPRRVNWTRLAPMSGSPALPDQGDSAIFNCGPGDLISTRPRILVKGMPLVANSFVGQIFVNLSDRPTNTPRPIDSHARWEARVGLSVRLPSMAEFTKLKIGFALALLGTLFALHPLLDRSPDLGFYYLGYYLKVMHAYALTSGLLGLCVYLYAVTLLNDHPHSWGERTGNAIYGLAIMIVPIYGGLFLSAILAERVAVSHVAWAAPAVAVGLGSGWIALSQVVAWRIRRRLGERDRASKMAQLAKQEAVSLDQARSLFESDHFDLCVVEAWRALESRLRQALLSRRVTARADDHLGVIRLATRRGILKEPTLGLVEELKKHWAVAVSTDPLPRDAAVESLGAVRYILSIVPVHEVRSTGHGGKTPAPAADLPKAA